MTIKNWDFSEPVNNGSSSLNFLGDWDDGTSYVSNDVVFYQSSSWVAVDSSTGVEPGTDPSIWVEFAEGTAGEDGKTMLSGSSDPTSGQGTDGDFYLNTTSCDLFKKIAGTWTLQVNIKGVAGDDGTNGNTILSGSVDPTTEGVNGDFYIQTVSQKLYKKESGTWVEKCLIQGVKGDDGDDGTDGRSYIWHGAYDSGHAYIVDDTVSYSGSSYVCILASTGNLPTNATYWNLLASKGEDGESGSLDIHGLTAETSFSSSDEIALYKASAAANRKMTYENLLSNLGTSLDLKGGATGKVLVKDGSGDYSFAWATLPTPSCYAITSNQSASWVSKARNYYFFDDTNRTLTFADPTSGTDDGTECVIIFGYTATGHKIQFSANGCKNVKATFNVSCTMGNSGGIGRVLTIVAYGGYWYYKDTSTPNSTPGTWSNS